jgi:hypothetical protein
VQEDHVRASAVLALPVVGRGAKFSDQTGFGTKGVASHHEANLERGRAPANQFAESEDPESEKTAWRDLPATPINRGTESRE